MNGPDAYFPPRSDGVLHRPMQGGGKQETDADRADTGPDLLGGQVERDAGCLEDIGAATFARNRAVAVLGHDAAGAGDDEGGSGGDVEGAGAIAAGSAGVDDDASSGGIDPGIDMGRLLAHDPDGPGNLLDRLPLDAQRGDEGPDLGRGGIPAHHGQHHLVHRLLRKILAEDHLPDRFLYRHLFVLPACRNAAVNH